ncbi:MAG: serine/threonine-protein kinase [Bacteroidota bacterium]
MPTTTPERWARLTDLLGDALDHPKTERTAFLESACSDDPSLIQEVEQLLAAHTTAAATQRFERGAGHLIPVALAEAAPPPDVGPYRLVRAIGQGGMGSVWLAERADGLYEQRVAVKLMRTSAFAAGPEAEVQRRRFRAERRILAGLDHPHIARLVDGGVTNPTPGAYAQHPYLVMEYVEGQPITDYCRDHGLGLADRLALFRTVCDAVAFAHQNLVVHRDLKPSNIFVAEDSDGRPVVKLLDFGIAKLLADDGEATENPVVTRTGQALLTPEYAAPEQLSGDAITTATDVYALGVVLYELLVGQRPYAFDNTSATAIERAILETEPTRPSTAVRAASPSAHVEPERLARRLRGDLDTIVLKALRKEPERRYRSAAELADDLRRHADGLPVTARPDTTGYRLRKFAARHQAGVAAAAALLVALVLGLAGTLWQARIAAAERDTAQTALRDAEAAMDFLESVMLQADLEEADPERAIGAVLDSAALRIDDELAERPTVAQQVHATMSDIYLGFRDTDQAEHHARRALALVSDSLTHPYGRALYLIALARDYRGDDAEAFPYYERAVAVLRPLPDSLARTYLARTLNSYGSALSDTDRYEDALAVLDEALPLLEAYDLEELPSTHNNIAAIHLVRGDDERAIEALHGVLSAMEAQDHAGSYEYGVAQANLAIGYAGSERFEEAAAHSGPAVTTLADALTPTHPETVAARATFAQHLQLADQTDAALQEADALLALIEADPTLIPPVKAYALVAAGIVLCRSGQPVEGRPALATSLALRQTMLPPDHWLIGSGLSVLGACDAELDNLAQAEPALREGYEIVRNALGAESARTMEAADRLRSFCNRHACDARSVEALAAVDAGASEDL